MRRGGGRTSGTWPTILSKAAKPDVPATRARPSTSRTSGEGPASNPRTPGSFSNRWLSKTRQIDESRSSLALVRDDGRVAPLTLGEDANFSLRIDPALEVNAPLVFTGHGLNIPDAGINDLEGLNLKGAVAVYFSTPTGSLPGPLQAHFGSSAERWRVLSAAGAIGTIAVPGIGRLEVPGRDRPSRVCSHKCRWRIPLSTNIRPADCRDDES